MRKCLWLVAAAAVLACPSQPGAQSSANAARTIKIEGVDVRVRTSGLERRLPDQPILLLEAGSGADLTTWNPVFDQLTAIAPVIAYDRLGLGESAADPKVPTLSRNVETLHEVLRALAAPPYVLVGHSLGGVIIRGFSAIYPNDVAGLVYLDVPDFEATREERASVLSGDARKRALEPPQLPDIPADTPAKLRPVFEQLLAEMRDDFPSARNWKQPANLPVGVIVTARADRLRGDGGAMVRLQIKHQAEWTLSSPDSLFTIAGHTGHQVHRDDPALVIGMVRHVYAKARKN
jgi:pimeloyl-ACP methyl ester carboxylesterase